MTADQNLFTQFSILNVDDDVAGRYAMSRILRKAGYQVEEAGTGGESLRMAAAGKFSLVILDVNLPDVSGLEVCRRLKSDPHTSHLPVLHLSATSVSSQAKASGLDSGADGYLVEPVDPEVLVATVRAMLRMRSAEEALRRSEAKFRRLAESNIIGITSGKGDRILEANSYFLEMLGYSQEDLAGGLSYCGITAPESAAEDLKAKQERLKRGASSPYEKCYLRKDGSPVSALVGAAALDQPDGNTWIEFTVDLAERKKLEEQFREAQKFESLGVMAAGIAHDFNNLLTGIMGSSSLLLDRMPPEHPDFPQLENILKASERAADLTRQILAYSGKGRSMLRRVSVSDAIRQIAGLLRSACPEGIRLEMHLSDDLPKVEADPAQIQQIAINLVTNAAEAIDESGEVRIRTEWRENRVCVEVRDTGRGMSVETQEKMFDPFYSTKFLGRGLGLAAVAGIVRSQKGSIQVESAPDTGTVVTILLPAAM